MEELGGGERDVVLAQAEDLARVRLARDLDVVVQVHDALRLAGRARAVEPERHVVTMRGRGRELVVLGGEARVELDDIGLGRAARDEADVLARERAAQAVERSHVGDHDGRVGVLHVVAEVLVLVELADRHGDRADAHRPEEGDREGGRVVEHEQHAVFAAHPELAQQVAGPVDLPAQVLVGQRRVGGDERRFVTASGLDPAVDDPARVVAL